jgi:hypothetical protein
VETGFKADEQQDGVASVMSTGKMDLRLNAQGQMEVLLGNVGSETANNTTLVYNKNLRDGQWHHLAVSVLKSTNGSGNIYIDGQQYKQISASVMPELFGDKLMLGGRRLQPSQGVYTFAEQLKGAIDEVRIWKGRRTANVIKDNMYARVKANEAGLVAYYPLEKNTRDAYNQVVAVGTLANSVTSGSSAEELSFFAADGTELSTLSSEILNSENTAALKQAPKKENVQFNFVASERQIKVNITEAPARTAHTHAIATHASPLVPFYERILAVICKRFRLFIVEWLTNCEKSVILFTTRCFDKKVFCLWTAHCVNGREEL